MKRLCLLTLLAPIAALGGTYDDGVHFLNAKDYSKAARAFHASAASGNAAAERRIGFLYYNGTGVEQDGAAALAWFERAAEHGDVESQVNLGKMYENGLFAPQDDAKSAHYFRLAAEQGHRGAQFRLGEITYLGTGVARDPAEAMKWWLLASDPDDDFSKRMNSMLKPTMGKLPTGVVAEGERRARDWKANHMSGN